MSEIPREQLSSPQHHSIHQGPHLVDLKKSVGGYTVQIVTSSRSTIIQFHPETMSHPENMSAELAGAEPRMPAPEE